jgi:hypothetical protein
VNLIVLADVSIVIAEYIEPKKNDLKGVEASLLFPVGEVGVLSSRPKIIVFHDDVAALIPEVDDDGFDFFVDIGMVFFDPQSFGDQRCNFSFHMISFFNDA